MQAFRDAVEGRDLDALVALLSEEVLFRSPAVHTPYQGRDQVKPLLRAVGQVLQDFGYTRSSSAVVSVTVRSRAAISSTSMSRG